MMMPMSVRPGDTLPEDTLTVVESDSDVEGLQVVLPLKLAVEFTLPRWVSKMKGLGRGFEGGATFVHSKGDGNCFFRSVSTALTFSKECPLGTQDLHDELR